MKRLHSSTPFVLIDDARKGQGEGARLFQSPSETIIAHSLDEIQPALEKLRIATENGAYTAGFISYEAGFSLEQKLNKTADIQPKHQRFSHSRHHPSGAPIVQAPLLWMGVFDRYETIPASAVESRLEDPTGAWLGPVQPDIDYAHYDKMVEQVQAYIAAGDVYQINLSFGANLTIKGHPLAIYSKLRQASLHPWGGAVFTGEHWILSASPELFFQASDGRLTARPMKGTAARHTDSKADQQAINALRSSQKERAENLMIVDLIRNDLSRIAAPSTVQTPQIFEVETYPTVHQMTSTVTARLSPKHNIIDAIKALFPCGSVTGAPKIRAMEIIAETEGGTRGVYTGSIGWVGPQNEAAFNVAIRTLVIANGQNNARLGLGSAIVADSVAASEWRECLAKSTFTTATNQPFDLIETMRFDPMIGIEHLDLHMQRLEASARSFDFRFDRHSIRNELQAAVFPLTALSRVRLLIGRSGAIAIETSPLPPAPVEPVSVALRPRYVAATDFRLLHKTTARAHLDNPRHDSGAFEVIFTDEEGLLTEGSFTSIFVERDGKLLTPPIKRGLLPGTLRYRLITQGKAIEADLSPADLGTEFFIGNALRGLIRARLVAAAP